MLTLLQVEKLLIDGVGLGSGQIHASDVENKEDGVTLRKKRREKTAMPSSMYSEGLLMHRYNRRIGSEATHERSGH